jgi:hypothetical protein
VNNPANTTRTVRLAVSPDADAYEIVGTVQR